MEEQLIKKELTREEDILDYYNYEDEEEEYLEWYHEHDYAS